MPMLPANQTIYMDAVLTPNDSLSPRAFQIVMGLTVAMSLVAGLMFLSMGAWPVIGFFGLDALALWFGFRLVRRRNREETRVRVTADTLSMHHRDGKGREKTAEVPAAFARIELDEPVGPTSWLRIEHGQTAYVIGRFLTPKERKSLAAGLRAALQRARAERHPA
jgi:uncharacterized membrane protein